MTTTNSNSKKQWILAGAAAIIAAFLLGFVPQYLKNSEMKATLQQRDERVAQLEQEARLSRMRDLASLLYLETTRKNYGLASRHATAMFDLVRTIINSSTAPNLKSGLETVLSRRDEIIAKLAKPENSVEQDLRTILDSLFQLTFQ